MKTAIYMPDDIFSTAEKSARRLKISRSELYTRAIKEYIAELEFESTTEKLNTIYAQEDSKLDDGWRQLQKRELQGERW
jgi:metal-responsive CopG/Arc/MetJ family transcriptional regulator